MASTCLKCFRLKDMDFNVYEKIMLLADYVKSAEFDIDNDGAKLKLEYESKDPMNTGRCFTLNECDESSIEYERGLLIREHEMIQEWGRHWDELRWNVSKWFLTIQTVFLTGAAKGLTMLGNSN